MKFLLCVTVKIRKADMCVCIYIPWIYKFVKMIAVVE